MSARQNFLAIVVAAIGKGLDGSGAKGFLGLLSHAGELVAVMDFVGDFVGDDEMVLRLHGALHVIANGSRGFARSLHGAGIGIGERNLRVFRLFKLRPDGFHALDFLFQLGNFILEPVDLDFRRGGLAVRGFKLGQVALDARLKLFQPLGYLGLREIPVARVHRLEFAAIDGNRGGGEQARRARTPR